MKIEKLTENKIRIILNADELSKKNIDIRDLAGHTDVVHSLFQSILAEAEKQIGFTTKDCKLFVEAFSSPDGDVIFTLTRCGKEPSTGKYTKNLRLKRKSPSFSCKYAVYKFKCFEEFCDFCAFCNDSKLSDLSGFAKAISLYVYKDSYYLTFSNIITDFTYINLFYTSISEFSNLVSNSPIFKCKLEECGKPIFKRNAIRSGIKYFVSV